MVRNFNELVLQQARIEDRIDRIGRQKAKQILDEKRERQVGLSRTGELFEPITKRLDIAHAYRKGERTEKEKELEAKEKKKKDDEMKALIAAALGDVGEPDAEGPVAEGPGAEGPGAEGPVVEGPGVDPKEFEELKKLLQDAITKAEGGVTKQELGELIDKSFQDIKTQVEAKPGGVSEERLEEMRQEYVDEMEKSIANIKIPPSMTEAEVRKIVEDATKEMKEEIKNKPGGITKTEVETIFEEGTKEILNEIKELKKRKELLEGAVGGVDPSLPEEMKLQTPPRSPGAVPLSQQPETSTPQTSSFDFGSPMQSRRRTTTSSDPSASYNPFSFQQGIDTEGSVAEDRAEGLPGETTVGEETETERATSGEESDDGNSTDVPSDVETFKERMKENESWWTKFNKEVDKKRKKGSLRNELANKGYEKFEDLQNNEKLFGSGNWADMTAGDIRLLEGATLIQKKKETPHSLLKKIKTKKGKGLDNSLTESERLKAFAIIKRNIGSTNAGNTSKQSVQQTINAIQLLFLSQEITNQQRINLLQKLKSAIR